MFLQGSPFPPSHYFQKKDSGGFSFKEKPREAPKKSAATSTHGEVLHSRLWFTCFLARGLMNSLSGLASLHRVLTKCQEPPELWVSNVGPSGGSALRELHSRFLRMQWTGLLATPPEALQESLLFPQGETQPASFSDPQEPWLSLSPPPWPAPDLAQLRGRAPSSPGLWQRQQPDLLPRLG